MKFLISLPCNGNLYIRKARKSIINPSQPVRQSNCHLKSSISYLSNRKCQDYVSIKWEKVSLIDWCLISYFSILPTVCSEDPCFVTLLLHCSQFIEKDNWMFMSYYIFVIYFQDHLHWTLCHKKILIKETSLKIGDLSAYLGSRDSQSFIDVPKYTISYRLLSRSNELYIPCAKNSSSSTIIIRRNLLGGHWSAHHITCFVTVTWLQLFI